jgi:hypothetical protein
MTEKNILENEEVSWKVDDIEMYGTITRTRDSKAPFGVVFIAWSGPTGRALKT